MQIKEIYGCGHRNLFKSNLPKKEQFEAFDPINHPSGTHDWSDEGQIVAQFTVLLCRRNCVSYEIYSFNIFDLQVYGDLWFQYVLYYVCIQYVLYRIVLSLK